MGISLSGLTESSTGNLTISAGSGNDVLIGNGSTQIFIDGGTDTLGIGGTAVSGSRLNLETGAVALDFITSTGTALNVIADTVNDTSGAATLAIVPTVQIGVMTYTSTNSMTYTDTASLYIAGIPAASTNVTFTNAAYALWVDAGAVRFDDRTFWIGGIAYEFPADNGNANEMLLTDGSGNLSWSSVASASVATTVTVTDNEDTNENNLIPFVAGAATATGNHGLEMDGDFTYSPNTGRLTATQLAGTLQTAAQANVTSLGTLTGLTMGGDIDMANNNVAINKGYVEFQEDPSEPGYLSDHVRIFATDGHELGIITEEHTSANTYTALGADTLTFIGASTISTAAGNLTVRAATGADVLIGDNETILYIDGGVAGVGIGTAPADHTSLHIYDSGSNSSNLLRLENNDASGTAAPYWDFRHNDDGQFVIWRGTSSTFMNFSPTGYVGIGTASAGNQLLRVGGTHTNTTANGVALGLFPAITTVTGSTSWSHARFNASVTTYAASNVYDNISTLMLDEPAITLGSGSSATIAATLTINDAPTEATSNYALFVDDGVSRFDGNVGIGTGTTTPTALLHTSRSGSGGSVQILIENTNADQPGDVLKFYKNSASPAVNDTLGYIQFHGDNSAAEDTYYSYIVGQSTNVTNGSEEGKLQFVTKSAGSDVNPLTLIGGNVGIGTTSPDVTFDIEKDGGGGTVAAKIENTGTAANDVAYLELKTAGNAHGTYTAPHVRYTHGGSTYNWYTGVDLTQYEADTFYIGAGTTVGSTYAVAISRQSGRNVPGFRIDPLDWTSSGTTSDVGGYTFATLAHNITFNSDPGDNNGARWQINILYGGTMVNSSSAQTFGSAMGATTLYLIPPSAGSNITFTHASGIHIANQTSAGTTTNLYGIYIDSITGGTNDYSIYTGSAQSYFGGKVGINDASPEELLHITGGNIRIEKTDGGTSQLEFAIPTNSVRGRLHQTASEDLVLETLTGNHDIRIDANTGNSNTMITMSSGSGKFGIGTNNPETTLTLAGKEGEPSVFNMWADEGDDNADKWRIKAHTDGKLTIGTYETGAWIENYIYLDSDIQIDSDPGIGIGVVPQQNYGVNIGAAGIYEGADGTDGLKLANNGRGALVNIPYGKIRTGDGGANAGAHSLNIEAPSILWDVGNMEGASTLRIAGLPYEHADSASTQNFDGTHGANVGIEIDASTFTKADGDIVHVHGMRIRQQTVAGSGTVTNLSSLYIDNAPAISGASATNGPYAIFVDSGDARFDGNVGIQTGSNTISGDLEVASTTGAYVVLRRDDTSVDINDTLGTIDFMSRDSANTLQARIQAKSIEAATSGDTPSKITFETVKNATTALDETMVIYQGNVGIGMGDGAAPTGKLDIGVNDTTAIRVVDTGDSNNLRIELGDGHGYGGWLQLRDDAETVNTLIRGYANPSGYGSYFLQGNIGIGTSTPGYKLEVQGNNSTIRARDAGGTSYVDMYSGTGGSDTPAIGWSDDTLRFWGHNANRMVITSSGNVGIKEASPDVLLHITDAATTQQSPLVGTLLKLEDTADTCMMIVSGSTSTAGIYFGHQSNADGRFRGFIRYDNNDAYLEFGNTGAEEMILNNSGGLFLSKSTDRSTAAAGIQFGASLDTNLYRGDANQLKTDDSLLLAATSASVNAELRQEYRAASNAGGFGTIRKVIRKVGIVDATATDVATITTTNESGNIDAGTYVCNIKAMVAHGGNNNAAGGGPTVKYWEGAFSQAIDYSGADGTSGVTEILNGPQAGVNDGSRGITSVAVTVTDTSVYVKGIAFNVDLSGSNVENAEVVVLIELIWDKFRTAPTIAAA